MRVLTEADVLRLIINSTIPAAEAFERWVFEDVLPSIRKTGGYTTPTAPRQPTKIKVGLWESHLMQRGIESARHQFSEAASRVINSALCKPQTTRIGEVLA